MDNLARFESDLWEAADNLRANSKLNSGAYFMPVLGVIFLRQAANRFDVATRQNISLGAPGSGGSGGQRGYGATSGVDDGNPGVPGLAGASAVHLLAM